MYEPWTGQGLYKGRKKSLILISHVNRAPVLKVELTMGWKLWNVL